MAEVQISVIIPAYNVEKEITETVDSVLNQCPEKEKIEILVVENGSTDRTVSVVEELSKNDPCVHLLQSEKGVSNARNMGILHAKGTWLVFLDADDRILPNGMSILFRDTQETETDIFCYGHQNGQEKKAVCDNGGIEYSSSQVELCKVEMLKNPTKYMQAWAKMIKRDLIVNNKILFNPVLRLSEDSDFILRCIQAACNVKLKSDIIYEYVINQTSAMRSFDGNKIADYITAMHETKKSIEGESEEVKRAFDVYVLMHMNIAMVRENFCFNNPLSLKKKYKNMKKILETEIFQEAIRSTKFGNCLSFRMAPILCTKLHMKWGAALIYYIRAKQNHLRENK